MAVIIVSGISGLNQSNTLIKNLEEAGYVYLDPDMFLQQDPSSVSLAFSDLIKANRTCLQSALLTVSEGTPVVMKDDFLGEDDYHQFTALGCPIEFVDADTPHASIMKTLNHTHLARNRKTSSHWQRFKAYQSLTA